MVTVPTPSFSVVRLREGHSITEVDDFLDELVAIAEQRPDHA